MNIYDIASKAGVSIATVSRILNKKGNVRKSTENKVLEVIEDFGYTPNAFARALGLNSIKAVGVLCSDVSDIYYAKAVSVIENELRLQGYDATLYCTGEELADKKSAISSLLSKKVDAVILVGSIFQEKNDNSHIEEASKSVPIVIINGEFEFDNTYSIYCEEEEAVADAVGKLVEKGHKDILYLYDSESFSGQHKQNGYYEGLRRHKIKARKKYVLKCERSFDSCKEAIIKAIDSKIKFSAVVCSEDILAVGVLKGLKEKGLAIPDDVAVIGFNNSILADSTSPSLTSIDNKVDALCTDAVRTLLDVFDGKDVSYVKKISASIEYRESFCI